MSEERCETCKFWLDQELEDSGICRRYPPSGSASVDRHGWPTTHPHAWCGEYRPKESEAK